MSRKRYRYGDGSSDDMSTKLQEAGAGEAQNGSDKTLSDNISLKPVEKDVVPVSNSLLF